MTFKEVAENIEKGDKKTLLEIAKQNWNGGLIDDEQYEKEVKRIKGLK